MAVSSQVVGVVAFYMVAALVMVFVNKIVLNATPNLPTLFMFFQSVMTVLLLNFTALFTSHVKIPTFDYTTAQKLTPLILIDASGFIFNALCLRDVEAAFYQIARGLVLPLTIAVVSVSSFTRPSLPVVGCAAIVTLGFFIGTSFSKDLPAQAVPAPLALFYGFLSSLAIAFHAVLVKSSLPHVGGSSTMLSYWSNLGSAILLGGLAILKGEVTEFWGMIHTGGWDWSTFLWGNLVTGVFGFLISIAGILSVKVTSPVTHMFSSAARSGLQVFLGVKLFGDVFTTRRALSVFTILCGTLLYTYIKSQEGSATPAPAPHRPASATPKDLEAQSPLMVENEKA
ncbi:GDP-fucose transporter 1 [Hypsizygus marmoreus]|uniref:GDP-mannose transporter n=1 Tax=Hypsizygus marmoreus TaxID=39966 RepID=A0A369JR68_HYPMA|nr:GDP-fucose transporter 1 [Hypsizygus marmoreus]